jgi:hypothetical protein
LRSRPTREVGGRDGLKMGVKATRGGRTTWIALVLGAAIGLVIGVVVSISTDIPFAPEVGLLIGLLVAWLLPRKRT